MHLTGHCVDLGRMLLFPSALLSVESALEEIVRKSLITIAASLAVLTFGAVPAFAAKTSIRCDDGKTVTISTTGGNCTSGSYGSCTTKGEKDFTSGGCIGGKASCGASGGTGECTITLEQPGGSEGRLGTKLRQQIAPNAGVKAQ